MKFNYFNFKEFENRILLTNDLGNHIFLSKTEFRLLLSKNIEINSELEIRLRENNFIYYETNLEYSSSKKQKIRINKEYLSLATSLHIFVVTTACNMQCVYCQANNGVTNSSLYMSKETAEKAVNIALQSPSRYLTFEFQGGEPLLNFKVIKHIVEYANQNKGTHIINYTIVSNLTLLTEEILDFLCNNHFGISTSIDGPEIIHNSNRPFRDSSGTFDKVVSSINMIREKGLSVGAIQTTTRAALSKPREIVHAYSSLGFDSIFLRPLTPLGKASMNWSKFGYTPEEFIQFYSTAIDELIKINTNGRYLKEEHASIFLKKIEGKSVNYMELRSPCGASMGQLAYYTDGNIFTCDEARMLHEMGDSTFKLGNVFENTYCEIINSDVCKAVCASSILETIPVCCDCVYQPYCGVCPVVNYAKSQDIIEKKPRSYRCRLYCGILNYLFHQISMGNEDVLNIFRSWSC